MEMFGLLFALREGHWPEDQHTQRAQRGSSSGPAPETHGQRSRDAHGIKTMGESWQRLSEADHRRRRERMNEIIDLIRRTDKSCYFVGVEIPMISRDPKYRESNLLCFFSMN